MNLDDCAFEGRKLVRRGRPRKGSTDITYRELGVTRQEMYEARKLSQIPEQDYSAFVEKRKAEGKRISRRSILVHFGKRKNVATDDIFVGTIYGDMAERILCGFENACQDMTHAQRRCLVRALRFRIREIDLQAEMAED